MNTKTAARLEAYQRRYRRLAAQLADIGYIAQGTLASRFSRCGKRNCACHADRPRLHGPYWHFTAKVDGKTVNRRLNDRQAELYNQWIANDRQVGALLAEMRAVAAKAADLLLPDASSDLTDPATGLTDGDTSLSVSNPAFLSGPQRPP